MNDFSDKEYENLRKDTADVRNCITRYLGFIIGVIGFSGALKYLIEDKIGVFQSIVLILIVVVVITFLFEIIWYKFKSHNRLVGYMQLLIQEQGAIPIDELSDEEIREKAYIGNYKEILEEKEIKKKLNHLFSWEYVMSRLNSNYFEKSNEQTTFLKAICKSRFTLTYPDASYEDLKFPKHDVEFFEKIILKLYGKPTPLKKLKFLQILRKMGFLIIHFFGSLLFLIIPNPKFILKDINIDKRYVVSGWKYPKKILQIAFAAITGLIFSFAYTFHKNYVWSGKTDSEDFLMFIIALTIYSFYTFWILKYVFNLKELVHGRNSIDKYCWEFFIYRVQLLNSKGLIPLYFSRDYLRYLKTNLYVRFLDKMEKNLKETDTFLSAFDNSFKHSEYKVYKKKLSDYTNFNDKSKEIHKIVVRMYKKEKNDYTYCDEYFDKRLTNQD